MVPLSFPKSFALFVLKYPSPPLHFFPFLRSSSLRFTLLTAVYAAAAMFLYDDEAVPFSCPLFETILTASDIQDLLSLVQSGEPASPSSCSQGSNRAAEKKSRRMQSNRESARRSRWRKKRHLENLTNQVNRLRIENRELKNRLGLTLHQHLLVSLENGQLRSESTILLGRLSDLYRVLSTMHLP